MPPDDEKSEQKLVQRCLAGNEDAWNEFLDQHYKTITFVAGWKKWSFGPHEIEDVNREILTECIKSLRSFQFKSSLGTFVYRVAVNVCIGQLRSKIARRRVWGLDAEKLEPSGEAASANPLTALFEVVRTQEDLLSEREQISLLRKGLVTLGEACRRLIRLRYWEEMSFREMADLIGAKENTLIVQLKRCLVRLMKVFRKEEQDVPVHPS